MNTGLTWFPLVLRPRPPGLPLQTRIQELAALAAATEEGTRRERVTRAAEVLNKAALIASDCDIPGLASELCHRQYELHARAGPLPAWAVRLALQPVLNIPRQLIRDGHGGNAYAMLEILHRAALEGTAAVIDGMRIDFGTLTTTAEGRKEARTLTWTALLADGTRALARAGRWKEAAERTAAYRGIGARLLDGRQAAILALLIHGQTGEATQVVEHATIAEPWEHTVQAALRVLCHRATGQDTRPGIAIMLAAACELAQEHDPATAAIRTRIALTVLSLAGYPDTTQTRTIQTALITTASEDAYAARDVLACPRVSNPLPSAQRSALQALVRGCGLGTGAIPARLHSQLANAVSQAGTALPGSHEQVQERTPAGS